MSIPALTAGINGINQGFGNLRRDASAIAQAVSQASNPDKQAQVGDVTTPLVNLKVDSLQVQASAKVVEAVDDIIGSLLDVTA